MVELCVIAVSNVDLALLLRWVGIDLNAPQADVLGISLQLGPVGACACSKLAGRLVLDIAEPRVSRDVGYSDDWDCKVVGVVAQVKWNDHFCRDTIAADFVATLNAAHWVGSDEGLVQVVPLINISGSLGAVLDTRASQFLLTVGRPDKGVLGIVVNQVGLEV